MNYERIAESIQFYQRRGYTWVDTDWIVSQQTIQTTFSGDLEKCHLGYLVGSAEQGFIQLIQSGQICPGNYVSAGPCFRFGDNGQPGKHPYFFKVELCSVGQTMQLAKIISDANTYLKGQVVPTEEGFDIEINGIEVGSYGSRNIDGMLWHYGTGLAEPRYTEATSKGKYS